MSCAITTTPKDMAIVAANIVFEDERLQFYRTYIRQHSYEDNMEFTQCLRLNLARKGKTLPLYLKTTTPATPKQPINLQYATASL